MTLRRQLLLAAAIAALAANPAHPQPRTLCDQPFDGDIVELYKRIRGATGAVAVPSRNPDFEVISIEPRGDLWNFTKPTHPAHPSVACRRLLEEGGAYRVRTDIQCRAAKTQCDKLAAGYNALDKEMTDAIRRKAPGKQ